jgi:tetratricopeptide (TPR) repeat protein
MRRLLVAALVLVSACAPKIVPPPAVTTPKFPEFMTPAVPPAFTGSPAAINESRGWAFLQNGDLKTAEHEFTAALRNAPAFYPAETSLGYVELARKEPKAALTHFDRVLEKERQDLSALVGRAQALLAMNRDGEALAALEAVLAVDPNQAEVRRRVEVLTFRVGEQEIARARQAARAGRLDEALQAYTTALSRSPDSPFLYRELAAVERQQGKEDLALEHFRKAVELDSADARSLTQIGEILEGRGDLEGALRSYTQATAVEASADLDRKIDDVRSKLALARLPAEYRAIDQATQVTRADLAALIGIRLGRLLRPSPRADAGVVTDVRNHWAQTWIVSVARAGIMEPYANHAFQPRTIVRRSDLAQAVARLLARVAAERPTAAKSWEAARLKFSDLAPSHLAYPAASVAVASGVMKTGTENNFQPSRPVTGAEAVDAIAKVESLAGLK